MKIRGVEFDEVTVKLFIERFIEQLGNSDAFYAKKLMEDIAFDDKEILVENEGMIKLYEVIVENEKLLKENSGLIDEVEYYMDRVLENEKLFSKFRLDELVERKDGYIIRPDVVEEDGDRTTFQQEYPDAADVIWEPAAGVRTR